MSITLLPTTSICMTPQRVGLNLQWQIDVIYQWRKTLVKDGPVWSYEWQLDLDVPFNNVYSTISDWSPLDNVIPPCCGNRQNLFAFKAWAKDWATNGVVKQIKANMLTALQNTPSEVPPVPRGNGTPNQVCNAKTHRDIANINFELKFVLVQRGHCDGTCQCKIKSISGDFELNPPSNPIQSIPTPCGPILDEWEPPTNDKFEQYLV